MADRRRLSWGDVAPALALLAFGLAGTAPAARNAGLTVPPPGYALVVVAALGLVTWRLRPLWTLTVTAGATLAYFASGYAYGPIFFSFAAAALATTLRLPLRRALVALGVVVAAGIVLVAVGVLTGDREWAELLSVTVWLVVPAAVGVAVKARRDATAEVRAARARRTVSEERLRLAQEVHDVAGHGFAIIAMQAGVALRVLDRDPAAARTALQAIRDTSRDALAGLRAEVEALQQGTAGPRRPGPGLADLPALVDRMGETGLPVTLDRPPSFAKAPPVVEGAAYRIVQEALTNVLRHAGPQATARVSVAVTDDGLVVAVRDTGRGGVPAPGTGITGMRERAAAVGGTLAAGPESDTGFAVVATLPLSIVEDA